MTPAQRYEALERSRSARSSTDVTTERRPMPRFMEGRKSPKGGFRLPSQHRVVDFPAHTLAGKAWQVTKYQESPDPEACQFVKRVVLSAHSTQADAELRAGEGRDALTDDEVGQGWNVVAERRPKVRT